MERGTWDVVHLALGWTASAFKILRQFLLFLGVFRALSLTGLQLRTWKKMQFRSLLTTFLPPRSDRIILMEKDPFQIGAK